MSDTLSNNDDRWLAAEFALGVLEGERLRTAQRKFESEPTFRQAVEVWQEQLSPLLDEIEPETPSPRVWKSIESRLFSDEVESGGGLWRNLGFWRSMSFVTGGLAAAAIAALLLLPPHGLLVRPDSDQRLVATLTSSGEPPAFVARLDTTRNQLVVRVESEDAREVDRVPELWLIPDDGVPRSLGLLSDTGTREIKVDPSVGRLAREGVVLAVSLEPAGGSPTGAPTGPVVASGALRLIN